MKRPAPEQSTLFKDSEPASNGPADLGWNAQSVARPTLRFPIPLDAHVRACRSCDARVFWIVTPRGRKMPVDADGTSHFATCPQADEHRSPR